jgi:hypothetical protein
VKLIVIFYYLEVIKEVNIIKIWIINQKIDIFPNIINNIDILKEELKFTKHKLQKAKEIICSSIKLDCTSEKIVCNCL